MNKPKREGVNVAGYGANVFFLHTGNDAFTRGERKKPVHYGGTGCMWLFMPMLVLLGISAAVFAVRESYSFVLLTTQRAETVGTYESRRTYADEGSFTYYVSYRYDVDGVTYLAEESVAGALYDSAPNGEPLRVYYAVGDPQVSSLGVPEIWLPLFLTAFAIFWNGFLVFFIVSQLQQGRKRNELLRSGRILKGEVSEAKSYLDGDNDYCIVVKYRVQSPNTRGELEGKAEKMDNTLRGTPLPAVGTPVLVFYASDDNHELL
jgi:hypothetical protein